MWKQLLTLGQLREKSSQVESSSLLLVVYSQLYLEAPWHRLRAGNVRPAGSTSSHSGWWWVNTLTHYLFSLLFDTWCIFTVFDVSAEKSLPTRFFSLPLPLSVLSEAMAFSCFTELMKRMNQNFPHGGAMDTHFANMRSLIQVTQHLQTPISSSRFSHTIAVLILFILI